MKRNLLKNNISKTRQDINCKTMVNKLLNLELPKEVWEIIDKELKLNRESDSEILCNIIRNYIAEHGLYPDVYSLTHEHGIKNYLNIHALMIESIVELLDKKGFVTSKEFAEWTKR